MFEAFRMHGIDPEEFWNKSPADREVIRAFLWAEKKLMRGELDIE